MLFFIYIYHSQNIWMWLNLQLLYNNNGHHTHTRTTASFHCKTCGKWPQLYHFPYRHLWTDSGFYFVLFNNHPPRIVCECCCCCSHLHRAKCFNVCQLINSFPFNMKCYQHLFIWMIVWIHRIFFPFQTFKHRL